MKSTADRKKIASALHGWIASPTPRQPVMRVLSGQRPGGPAPAYFMEAPRIILVLEGCATFLTIDPTETLIYVQPGQMLFLAPYTWIAPVPREPYSSLGITFRNDYTRLIITKRKAMTKSGRVEDRCLAQWRTLETLGTQGEHLLQLMRDKPIKRLEERMFIMLSEILVTGVTNLVDTAPEYVRAGQTVLWQVVSEYLAEHWSDPQLSRKTMAAYFNRHPNHFSRFFHAHAKKNFRTYINEIRLERSMRFLRDMRYNVTDVAGMCGFTDVPYFIHCFRKRYGITPGDYRRRHEN